MTDQSPSQLFKALMHPTRLAILEILREGEECVCHMEAILRLRQAHISQHLMILRETGLVSDRRDGWNIFYRVIRHDIYQVIDSAYAFYDIQERPSFSHAQDENHACPCPKCNPGAALVNLEIPSIKIVETRK